MPIEDVTSVGEEHVRALGQWVSKDFSQVDGGVFSGLEAPPQGLTYPNTFRQQLEPSVRSDGDEFGISSAISGDGSVFVVGARRSDNKGAAFIFRKDGELWSEEAKIQPADLRINDFFGESVAISEDGLTVVIGATGHDANGSSSGAAYVFGDSAGTWSQQGKLYSSNIGAGDKLGDTVAISGDGNTLGVYASGEDSGGSSAGSIYLFVRTGGNWVEERQLQSDDVFAGDRFAASMSFSYNGNYLVTGVPSSDPAGSSSGSAYIFYRFEGAWSQRAETDHI